MILLNTRPLEYAAQFAADFAASGLLIINSPVLRFEPVGGWPASPARYDALIFTSPAAPHLRPADAGWNSLPVYAVGPATAAAARAAGFEDVRQTGFTAAELASALRHAPFSRALYPSGADVTIDLSALFPGRIERAVVFRAVTLGALSAPAHAVLNTRTHVYAPLFSRRSAQAFAEALKLLNDLRAEVTAVGISAAVLDVKGAPWTNAIAASTPTSAAMAAVLADHLSLRRLAA